jgi:hypothetical protein
VEVTRSGNESSSLCDSSSGSIIYIEFLTEFGDLPLMTSTQPINITEYQTGSKEDLECSGQGICSESTGICRCRSGYGSSNGSLLAVGERGDCSYFNPFYTILYDEKNRPVKPKKALQPGPDGNKLLKTVF